VGVDLRGQAVFCFFRAARTVRGKVADGLRVASSSRVRRVLASLCFRSGLAFGFCCSWFADGPSFSSERSGTHADGPPGLRGRSVFLGSLLLVLCALSDGPRRRAGQFVVLRGRSAAAGRTVREASADGPPLLAGRSARACVLCFLVRFLPSFSRASACASRKRS
jgi:hypothetical protein